MYLKSVEIKGFKSFAEKVSLSFPSNLVGIVGPNGSGKSNICDALRWVLGEQSAKSLRGEKMNDIIFAGTEEIKPAGMAYVSLTFDNRSRFFDLDWSEVNITRRLFRTGESEYLINGNVCRLKDIKDIIMDTGLGKEAYSIIAQGTVADVVSSNSDARREIIEEAAGIVKYKFRKAESVRKLNSTRENIVRVNDLIKELERQIEPLSIQAQIAERYLRLKEEYDSKYKNLLALEQYQLKNKIEEQSALVMELRTRQEEHRLSAEKARSEIEKLRLELSALGIEQAKLRDQNYSVSSRLEVLEVERRNAENRLKELDDKKKSLEAVISNARLRLEEINVEIQNNFNEKKNTEMRIASLKEDIVKNENELKTAGNLIYSSESRIEDEQDSTIDHLNRLASLKNEKGRLEAEIKGNTDAINRLNVDITRLSSRRDELAAKIEEAKKELETAEKNLAEVKMELAGLRNQLQGLESKEASLRGDLEKLGEESSRLGSTLEMKEKLKRSLEGFKSGVRALLEARSAFPERFRGFYGVVAHLIEVPAEIAVAIEIALGNNLQAMIVENSDIAKMAINFLKENNAGRGTFIPLDMIKPRPRIDVAEGPNILGNAMDLVGYDKKFEKAIQYLLGNVIVVRDIDTAIALAKTDDFRGKVVTLAGEIINAAGVITGGYVEKSPVHLSSDTEIVQLKNLLNQVRATLERTRLQHERTVKNISDISRALGDGRVRQEKLEMFIDNEKELVTRLSMAYRNTVAELEAAEQEVSEFKETTERLRERLEQVDSQIAALEKANQEREESLLRTQAETKEMKQKHEALTRALTDLKVELAGLIEREMELGRRNEVLHEEKARVISHIENSENELKAVTSHSVEAGELLAKLREEEKGLKDSAAEFLKALEVLNRKSEEQENEIRAREGLVASKERSAYDIESRIHRLELETKELEEKIRTIESRAREEYFLEPAALQEHLDESLKKDEVTRRLDELRAAIAALGTVNTGAIEQFRNMTERIRFLQEQKKDLENARESIFKVMDEIDQTCKVKFKETFELMNRHLDELFKALFGGGRASLVLEDETNLLESRIDIVAQLPGERLKPISLLSGGEKTLTALALFFAVLKIKPTPFCILDEVEAALDDVNVTRFMKLLETFKDRTQFLLITHNKETMQHMDILYGVTMVKKGVSKIVSVALEEAERVAASSAPADEEPSREIVSVKSGVME